MSETLDALQAEIERCTTPKPETMELSKRCITLAFEYAHNFDSGQGVDKVADEPYRWLSGQWLSIFEAMDHIASTHNAGIMLNTMSHIKGIAATMKMVNYPWWHLFYELANELSSNFDHLFLLCETRAAMAEAEEGNEHMH